MEYIKRFDKIVVDGSIQVQLIRVDPFTTPSIMIPFESRQKVTHKVENNILYIKLKSVNSLRRYNAREQVTIRHNHLEEIKAINYSNIRSETIRDIKKIDLEHFSEINVNNFLATNDSVINLEEQSILKVHSNFESTNKVNTVFNISNQCSVFIENGSAYRMEANFFNSDDSNFSRVEVSNFKIFVATPNLISLNVKDLFEINVDKLYYKNVNVKQKQEPYKNIIENKPDDKTTKTTLKFKNRIELLKKFRIHVSENDILTFLDNEYCFEELNKENRKNILDLIMNLTIEEKDLFNKQQTESMATILRLYKIKNQIFRF